jgi:hypothetical protein
LSGGPDKNHRVTAATFVAARSKGSPKGVQPAGTLPLRIALEFCVLARCEPGFAGKCNMHWLLVEVPDFCAGTITARNRKENCKDKQWQNQNYINYENLN